MTKQDEMGLDSVERLATMSADEVNDLPYGFLILDREGVVQLYNRYESRMSRLPPERVVGRNWFRDVAPCTRVEAFFGRYKRLVDDPEAVSDRFSFRFHFLHGAQDVLVGMTRAPQEGSVFMTVVRQNLTGLDVRRPAAIALDENTGVVAGPAGVTFPLPASVVARLLDALGPDEVRALGGDAGRSLLEVAEREAAAVGEADLGLAPLPLRSGVLDGCLTHGGFGRLALDLSARETTGVIGLTVRPPTAAVTPGLATYYEGLLAAVLASSSGPDLLVRCLDSRDTPTLPWLFAAVPTRDAALLDEAGRVPAVELARRLGLSVDGD